MTDKKSFLMYRDYGDVFESMSDEDAGLLIKALFAHEEGRDVALEGQIRATFMLLAKQLDRDRTNYEAMCERNRANGRKGGRPSLHGGAPEEPGESPQEPAATEEKPKEPTGTQSHPTISYKDKDKDNDMDTDKDEESVYNRGGSPHTHTSSSKLRFQKPSLDDVKAYCAERGNGVDAQRFVDFYASKGWMVGKSPMKDWRASVRLWEQDARAAPGKDKPKVIEYIYSEVI